MRIAIGVNDTGELLIRLDPHDGTCGGAHDVIVLAMMNHHPDLPPLHVTLGWATSVLLSIEGSEEFAEALKTGIELAKTIGLADSVAEASRMADDFAVMLKQAGGKEI